MENNEDNEVFTEKILKTLEKYKDNTTPTIARIIEKHCNRESLNNVEKKKRNNMKNNIKSINKKRNNNKNANQKKIMINS